MSTDINMHDNSDAAILNGLENVYHRIQLASEAKVTPERSGLLNALRIMLEPSLRAARLLVEQDEKIYSGDAAG